MIYYNEWTDTGPTHDTGTCVGVAVANGIQLFLILQLDRFGTSFQRLEVYGNAQQCTRLSECFPVFTNMIQQSRSAQLVHLIPTIGYRYYTISESLVQNNKPKRSFKSFLRFTAAKIIPGPSNILRCWINLTEQLYQGSKVVFYDGEVFTIHISLVEQTRLTG